MVSQDNRTGPLCRISCIRSTAIALVIIGALSPLSRAGAQQPPASEFQPYVLRYAPAAKVENALSGLLPPGSEVVADQKANRLLVRGSAQAHQIVQKVIDSLDLAPAGATPPVAQPGSQSVLRSYSAGAMDPVTLAADLQARIGNDPNVRIVSDKRTAQVLVVAPTELQQHIAAYIARAESPMTAAPAQGQMPAPTQAPGPGSQVSLPGSGLKVAIGTSPSLPNRVQEIQLQRVPAAQVENSLVEMLGNRLMSANSAAGDVAEYRIKLSGNRSLGLSIDRRTHRVVVEGSGTPLESCIRLVRALDDPVRSADQSLRMVSLRMARAGDIQRTVDAIRSGDAAQGQSSRDNTVTVKPAASAPEQAAAQAQPAPGRGAVAAPGANAAAVRGAIAKAEESGSLIGSVQIEYLEGLDVMVLRGHRRDVQQVIDIIEQIEKLSAQTQPSIELYPMQHVQCEAMVNMVRQLYDEVFASRQGNISITALVKPNALLLIGRPENVNTVLDLVKRLDQPVAPETQFQVFPLRHASATTAQTTVQNFFTQRGGLGPVVYVTSDYRSNSLIVQASPRDMAEVAAMLNKLDTPTSEAVNELRVFKLENTLADEVASVLQSAITGRAVTGARTTTQLGAALPAAAAQLGQQAAGAEQKSNMLRFITIDAHGQQRLSSGILTDVRITSDPRANSLLVSAPAESMPLLEALIKQIDKLPAMESQIKVFTIVNGDATTLIDILQTLFLRQGTTTGMAGAFGQAAAMAMRTASASGESPLVQLRFAADARTNSIIASGSAGDLSVVEAILLRLDEGDIRNRKNIVYQLKNSPAQQVATALNQFLTNQRTLQQQAGTGLVSPFEQMEHEVVVVPEVVRNALIISATPRYFEEIQKIVEDLDARPPMVMIQVLIAQVQLGSTDEFGVELGLQDSILFDRSVLGDIEYATQTLYNSLGNPIQTNQTIVSATNTPGYNFNTATGLGNSGSSSSLAGSRQVGTQGLTSLGVGRVNSQLGYGGLVLSASSESVSALLRALKQCTRMEVLSRPQVMTMDNQPAFIQVGQRVPRISGVQVQTTGQVNNITMDNVGLIMAVTPRISPDGLVVMEIDAENSKVGPESEGIPVSINVNGDVIRSPRIDTTVAQTTVSATSGQTVVLGGLITKSKSAVHRRVPLLSEIPVIGNLFRYDSEIDDKNELLIIMTPHIVKNERDLDRIKQMESARIDWCLADVVKIHGDAGLRGRKDDWSSDEVPVVYPDVDAAATSKSIAPGAATPELMPSPAVAPGQPTQPAQRAPQAAPAQKPNEPGVLKPMGQEPLPQNAPQQLPGNPS